MRSFFIGLSLLYQVAQPTWAEPRCVDYLRGMDHEAVARVVLARAPLAIASEAVVPPDIVSGKRFLITGGGGSVADAVANRLRELGAESITLLDRSEIALFQARQRNQANDTEILADLNDTRALNEAFARVRPDVVIHTAATKHIDLAENNPLEAIRNNIFATETVLKAAAKIGCPKVIVISTDKAASPTSMLGMTKNIAERLALSFSDRIGSVSVLRFGNVFGSSGSVVEYVGGFIDQGATEIPVRDPEIQRFFLTPREASNFVLSFLAVSRDGLYGLDMGTPITIRSLTEGLVRAYPPSSELNYRLIATGARAEEKNTESLVGDNETIIDRNRDGRFLIQDSVFSNRQSIEDFMSELRQCMSDSSCDPAALVRLFFGQIEIE